jgi:hypothetical protein
MNIGLGYRRDFRAGRWVDTYATAVHEELKLRGHNIIPIGEGHDLKTPDDLDTSKLTFHLDLDNGRNSKGELSFFRPDYNFRCPTGVWFIDSHGNPTLHHRAARYYTHVFFAVWAKREIFQNHKSVHWCPNATDSRWFSFKCFPDIEPTFDFGFFGSRGGLDRANPLKNICHDRGWSCDIRQVAKPFRHKFPQTGAAMAACRNLFNHGQKHDPPNLRVMESMLMNRPLLTDTDPRSGISKLFTDGYHYIGYESYTHADLEEKMEWVIDHPEEAKEIAYNGYQEVRDNHTISNRVEQILGVIRA